MKEMTIFGKKYTVVEQNSGKDSVRLKNNNIFISHHKKSPSFLLKEFLTGRLDSQLLKIYRQIKNQGKVEVFGNLDFEVVGNIDNKKKRIAKITGNKILVKLSAIALPRSALRYIIAHEVAHTFTKKHTEKFWKIVHTIYPGFKKGQKFFT